MTEEKDDLSPDLFIKRNGIGWMLCEGDEERYVTPAQVIELMESILKSFPGLVGGVDEVWKNRHKPVAVISAYYGVEGGEIKLCRYKAHVEIQGKRLARAYTKEHPTALEATKDIERIWGESISTLSKFVIYEGSRKLAQEKLTMDRAEAYCEAQGITLDELWTRIRKND